MLIVSHDKAELESIRETARAKLVEIGFELHPTKTKITPLSKGVMFLGFIYRLTDTGKVLMFADPARIKAARRKYKRMADKVKRGELSEQKLRESYICLRSHIAKGNSHNLIGRMDEYINKLLEVENGNHNCPKGTSRP